MKAPCLAVFFVVATACATVRAQEAQPAAWTECQGILASLERENEDLRTRLVSLESQFADASPKMACCSRCKSVDCRCESRSKWVTGASFYYIKPHWENNPAYASIVDNPPTLAPPSRLNDVYSQVDLPWDYRPAWDIWFGFVTKSGFGFRTRYFQFDHLEVNVLSPPQATKYQIALPRPLGIPISEFGQPIDSLIFGSKLEMHVVDVEATQVLKSRCWQWEASGGIRWARVEQAYVGVLLRNPQVHGVSMRHDFEGVGPVLGLEGRRELGTRGLSFYGKARASVIFGEAGANAAEVEPSGIKNTGTSTRWDLMPIGELEIGLKYARRYGNARAFAELGLVGHVWFGAGNASNSGPASYERTGQYAPQAVFNNSNNDNLGLLGGRFAMGIDF